MVQLLANGLVLQFLGIELIWAGTGTMGRSEGTEWKVSEVDGERESLEIRESLTVVLIPQLREHFYY